MDSAFQLTELPGPIGVVTFDVPGKKVNTLSKNVRAELEQLLSELERRTNLIGLLFRSGKAGQFVAGADLRELAALSSEPPEQTRELLEQGHRLLNRLAALPYPTVALVDGVALGGGTELALACDYRLASPAARFGLPETKLGMIPAWGGTQRLPRTVDGRRAVEMILGGESISADESLRLQLVSGIVQSAELTEAGSQWISRVRQSGDWQKWRRSRSEPASIDSADLNSAAAPFENEFSKQSAGRSAAQQVALETFREGLPLSLPDGLAVELHLATKVIGTAAAAELINEFFRSRTAPGSASR